MNNGHHTKSLLRGKEPEPVYEGRHPVAELLIAVAKLALAIAAFCAIAIALAYLLIG
jgi:hypothetical protein